MDIGKINALQGILNVGVAQGSGPAAAAGPAAGTSFLDVLKQSLDHVAATQGVAESTAQQFQLGQNQVSIEDAMIATQKANIEFQATVQIRNKVVAAYNDIMNMPV